MVLFHLHCFPLMILEDTKKFFPDFVYFIAPTFSNLLQDTIQNLEDHWYEECR